MPSQPLLMPPRLQPPPGSVTILRKTDQTIRTSLAQACFSRTWETCECPELFSCHHLANARVSCYRAQLTPCQTILKATCPHYQPPALFLSFDRQRLIFFSQLTEEKGTSPPDYRHYLRMWAKEKEVQKETIKDLPKMNQVGPTRTCF